VAQAAEDDAPTDVVEVVGKRLDEGLGTRYTAPLLETPQMRVLQISPQERVTRLR